MIIHFKQVKIHNFLSIGDAEVDLENKGYSLITGINKNPADNAKSNGSGKTAISEAILWALTGETFRGIKNVVNIHTTGGTSVTLNFKVDNKEYSISRYKEHKEYGNNLKIIIDGKDMSGKGIRDGEALLKQYLPDISTQLIGSVIILGQGLPQRFSDNTPGGRKEILEKLSKSDFMVEDIKNKLGNRKNVLNTQLRQVEDNLLKCETQKKVNLTHINNLKFQLDNLPDVWAIDFQIEELNTKISKFEEDIEEEKNNEAPYSQQISELDEKITKSLSDERSLLDNISNSYNGSINEAAGLQYKLNSDIRNIKNEIARLESITDVCPTCHQKLPDVIKPDTTTQRNQLKDYENQLVETTNKLNDLRFNYHEESNKAREKFESDLNNLKNQKKELENISNKSKSTIASLEKDKNSALIKLNGFKSQKENLNSQKQYLIDSIANTQQEVQKLDQDILYNKSEKDLIEEKISIVNKMFTIVTRDFRGFLLTNVINFINNKVKEYSKEVFGNDHIEFTLDGNNINISYDDKQLESLSGGERQKVDIIIQFALRDMLIQHLNFDSNILFIDEVFDGLDAYGCEKIIDLISTKSTSIESLFIITHHASELSIPYDNEIIVEKNKEGISYIK